MAFNLPTDVKFAACYDKNGKFVGFANDKGQYKAKDNGQAHNKITITVTNNDGELTLVSKGGVMVSRAKPDDPTGEPWWCWWINNVLYCL